MINQRSKTAPNSRPAARGLPGASGTTGLGKRRPANLLAWDQLNQKENCVKALKIIALALGVTLGALIVIPLLVLAGLFIWLKLTEETDEGSLEQEQTRA
jgi:hypothetical protein